MSCKWLPGEHEAVTCSGKIRYASGAAAGKAKQHMKKKHYKDSGNRSEVAVYHCQYCGWWHLGRVRPLKGPARKEKHRRRYFIR